MLQQQKNYGKSKEANEEDEIWGACWQCLSNKKKRLNKMNKTHAAIELRINLTATREPEEFTLAPRFL